MSDTYFIPKIKCAHCGKENNFVKEEAFSEMGLAWHFDFDCDFVCDHCKKKNKIKMEFKAEPKTGKHSSKNPSK